MKDRINVFIQARMGSSRLPGKVLLPLDKKTVLEHVISNISSKHFNPIVLTSTNKLDDAIEKLCNALMIDYFRGSENNVLERYLAAAQKFHSESFVRICSDSPFISSQIIEKILSAYDGSSALLSTREITRDNKVISYNPKGLSVDYIKTDELEKLYNSDITDFEKEHVIPGFFHRNYKCQIVNLNIKSSYNLVIDTAEDYETIKHEFLKIKESINIMEYSNE